MNRRLYRCRENRVLADHVVERVWAHTLGKRRSRRIGQACLAGELAST